MVLLAHTAPNLPPRDRYYRPTLSELLRLVTPLLVSSDPARWSRTTPISK